jgi:hypothetical protein
MGYERGRSIPNSPSRASNQRLAWSLATTHADERV